MTQTLVHKLAVTGPEDKTSEFRIPLGVTTLGRQAGVDLQLDNAQVSRRHARLVCTKLECEISDEGSSNGTYLNGEKLTPKAPAILSMGDTIKIGPFTMIYLQEAIEIPDPEPEQEASPQPPKPVIEPVAEAAETPQEPAPVLVGEADAPPEKVTAGLPEEPGKEPPSPPAEKPPLIRQKTGSAPPPPPVQPPAPPSGGGPVSGPITPPGLELHSQRLIKFLPGIYHTDFMSRFLGMFEAILTPIEWNVENFDLYLDPGTAPASFLPWLANWFGLATDPSWSEAQRRALLEDAHTIFARRGTRWALGRVLEIYIGQPPEIIDDGKDLDPHTFAVRLPVRKREVNPELIEALIDAHKPAHTLYEVTYRR